MVYLHCLTDQFQERLVLAVPVEPSACVLHDYSQAKKAWKFSVVALLSKEEIHHLQLDT